MARSTSDQLPERHAMLEPERGLSARALAAANDRMIATRWVAGVLVLALTLVGGRLFGLRLEQPSFFGLGAAILAYNVALALGSLRLRSLDDDARLNWLRGLVFTQVALDWLATAVFLNLSGGICSPGIVLFIIHMLMLTILLPHRYPYLYAFPGVLLVALVAGMEWSGHLPHRSPIAQLPPALHRDPEFIAGQLAFFFLASLAAVHLVGLVVRTLRERDTQLGALLQASRAVSSTLSLPVVLETLAESTAKAFGAAGASIRLLDEAGEELSLAAAHGLSEAYLKKGPVQLSRSPIDREVLAGRPAVISDVAHDARVQYPREIAAEGVGSILVVPLVGRAGRLGVLRIYGDRPGFFDQVELEFAQAFGEQGAVALQNAMTHERLQALERDRALFVRTVTHELRSPVSGSRTMLLALLEGVGGELAPVQRETLARVDARLTGLAALVDDLLVMAEARAEQLQDPIQDVELVGVLGRLAEQFAAEARAKGLDFAADLLPAPVCVRGTVRALDQIFGNLLSNAVKYTPAGGKMALRSAVEDGRVLVTVSDTGIGIPEEERGKLWAEFFRARNAKRTGVTGTGLGLSIVKRLLTRLGGQVSVQSEEGRGTTFVVTLLAVPGPRAG